MEGRTAFALQWIETLISTSYSVLVVKMFGGSVHGIMKSLSEQVPIRVSLKNGLEHRFLAPRDNIPLDHPTLAHKPKTFLIVES